MKHLIDKLGLEEVSSMVENGDKLVKDVFELEKHSYLSQHHMYHCLPIDQSGKRVAALPVIPIDYIVSDDGKFEKLPKKLKTIDFVDLTG